MAHPAALQAAGGLDPSKATSQYVHDQWLVTDGLPSAAVQAIAQTRDGYLWLGTQDGLVRFDGARFTIFDKSSTPEIRSDDIRALLEGHDGSLWIGMLGGGLLRLKGGNFTRFSHEDGLATPNVHALLEEKDGTLWIGTGGGVYRLKDKKVTREVGLSNDYVLSLAKGRDGSIWIGTRGGGVHRWKDEKITPLHTFESCSDDTIWSLLEDRDGSLWIGTLGEGLKRLKDDVLTQFSTRDGLSENRVASLFQDQAGTLWVGTFQGLDRLRDGRITHVSMKSPSSGIVHSILQDREGSLWFGNGSGLQRLRDGKFTLYSAEEGLSTPSTLAVLEDHERTLWVGTDRGVNRVAQNQVTVFPQDESLTKVRINSLAETSDHTLWIATDGAGLWKLEQGRLSPLTIRDGLPSDIIMALAGARDGSVWLGTYNAGVVRLKDDKITAYSTRDGLSSNTVRCILERRDGSLWVGTDSGGLNRFKDGKWTHERAQDAMSDESIYALHEDAEGALWIATGARGLYRWKDDRLSAFTVRDGLFSDAILAILEDDTGRLWMGCNKGIFSVHKQELYDFADGRSGRIHCTTYDVGDGMRQREVNGGTTPSAWRGRDGRLWFPTTDGIVGIDPSHIPINTEPPPVTIEAATVDGRTTSQPANLVFPPGSEKFEIQYTATSLVVPDRVRFRYRLEGFDKEWNDVGTRRVAYYTHLPPGDFTFRVIACNNDGVWNETGAALAFRLEPFFYQTSWFYGLCVAGALLGAYGAYVIRLWRLKAKERELVRLVKERTQELEAEKSRSERLLLNVLPAPIAFRLQHEESIADHFTDISVLFCDIADFTELSATMSPKDVVMFLNRIFSAFDRLVEKHSLEKIKTIGDAYMVASGLPTPREDHAEVMAEMALDMLEALGAINAEHGLTLKVRIGIHSGPVVAGVIGLKKFSYDLWGDTVNTASRMESHGIVEKIQVSEAMYRKLKDGYVFQPRGSVEIKGKGRMLTYLLIGRRTDVPPALENAAEAAGS